MTKAFQTVTSLCIFCVLLTACSTTGVETPYINAALKQNAGRMAILPFDNLSDDPGASKTMENMVLVEFLRHSTPIIDPGQVMEGLLAERIRLTTSIPRETLLKLGQHLDVQYFLLGVVHEYKMQRLSGSGGSGEIPLISMTLRILSAETGEIIWATSATRRGNDREKVFGIGRVDSIEQLAQTTATELAQEFSSSIRRAK